MNIQHIFILFAILVFVVFLSSGLLEGFISSGALVQLAAKGPQDWYLTGWPYGHGRYWYPYGGLYGYAYPYLGGYPYFGNPFFDNPFYHVY